MAKILSQSGNSLADVYDVQGSIAGIDQLESREVTLVHEMGRTMFSERFSGFIRRSVVGPNLQSVTFDALMIDLPEIARVVGVTVLADTAGRTDRAQVSVRDPLNGREMPIYIWDVNDGASLTAAIRIEDNGILPGADAALIPSFSQIPSFTIGTDQPQSMEQIAFRGVTSAFGAGNVTYVLLVYLAFAAVGGLSSRGLPIPSW